MNIQEQITEQQAKHNTLRALLNKDYSIWTAEDTSRYRNKESLEVEKQLVEVSIQLLIIELYLKKPLKDWTDDEKEEYESKDLLRKKEGALRKEKEALLQLKLKEEPSILTKKRPATPEEEKHVEFLKSIMLRTKDYNAVTPIGRHQAVTHHHGSHSKYVVGGALKLFPATSHNSSEYIEATVVFLGNPDFMVLESKEALCSVDLEIRPARACTEYVQIGLSGADHSLMHRRGHISNDHVVKNGGFYLGSAGCSKGDSGGGVFSVNSQTLYGICCATYKSMGKMDFNIVQVNEIGNTLNRLASHLAQPVMSCISPSTNFTPITGDFPYADDFSSQSISQ